MITPEFPPKIGGIGVYAFNLSRKLVERGHEVTVITQGDPRSQFFIADGIEVHRVFFLHLRPFHIHLHTISVNRCLKSIERKLDIIHMHLPGAPPIFTSLPVIVTVHTLTQWGWTTHGVYNLMKEAAVSDFLFPLERRVLRRAQMVTSVSNTVAEELYKLHKCKAEVVCNGVDTDFFVPKNSDKNPQTILYSGRLTLEKGLVHLIKCARYVCNKYPSATFVIAGRGPLEKTLKRLSERNGLNNNLKFLGGVHRNELLLHYQNSTLFVLPSFHESFPNSLLEAMACGLPIVATKVGDIPQIINDGENGFLVEPKNPYGLAQAIIRLLEDEKLRHTMGKASRSRAEVFYSLNVLAEKMFSHYNIFLKTH